MTPPRCRQVGLISLRYHCTGKQGIESSHSDENRGVLEYERRTSCWLTAQAETILTILIKKNKKLIE
jgi:hypothetical protein